MSYPHEDLRSQFKKIEAQGRTIKKNEVADIGQVHSSLQTNFDPDQTITFRNSSDLFYESLTYIFHDKTDQVLRNNSGFPIHFVADGVLIMVFTCLASFLPANISQLLQFVVATIRSDRVGQIVAQRFLKKAVHEYVPSKVDKRVMLGDHATIPIIGDKNFVFHDQLLSVGVFVSMTRRLDVFKSRKCTYVKV